VGRRVSTLGPGGGGGEPQLRSRQYVPVRVRTACPGLHRRSGRHKKVKAGSKRDFREIGRENGRPGQKAHGGSPFKWWGGSTLAGNGTKDEKPKKGWVPHKPGVKKNVVAAEDYTRTSTARNWDHTGQVKNYRGETKNNHTAYNTIVPRTLARKPFSIVRRNCPRLQK